MKEVSAFFPCYNDAPTIAALIESVSSTLERLGVEYEVIVVDDASTDRSPEVLEQLQARMPWLRVVRHPFNRGYGGALLSGFAKARRQWVFYTDGDGQYDPTEVELLIKEATDDVDVVQGYKVSRSDPLSRKIVGRLYHRVASWMFALQLRDVDCDFRLIRRDVLEQVQLFHTSGVICVEMVRKLHDVGARFVEVPVSHHPRLHGTSQFFNPRSIVRALGGLMMLRLELTLERHRGKW
ncbi:MAG: glycosyltransferase family 2 protein [Actinomycetota bacterium]|nr:glycosyltransferase family 2 protein [Actinomycetota bacterium]